MGGRGGGGDGGRVQGGKGSAAKGNGSRCNAHYQQSTVGAANESPSFPLSSLFIPLPLFSLVKLAFLTSLNRFEVCRPGGVEMRILQHWLRLFNAF